MQLPNSFIVSLEREQWAGQGQTIFSMALFDELLENPARLSDPAFTGYLLGTMGNDSKTHRDMFIPVAILGLETTVSFLIAEGGMPPVDDQIVSPEELELPPALTGRMDLVALLDRDQAQDTARVERLLRGQHVGRVDEVRLATARAVTLALAATDIPPEIRANLLCLASFCQWMEGDTEGADMNALLACMSDLSNKLAGMLVEMYSESDGPMWREVQKGRGEAA